MRSDMEAVAAAAIAWNRARLARIAIAKQVPPWPLPGHTEGEAMKRQALGAEAKAKAALRKACMAADPKAVVLDVEARAPRRSLPPIDVIDV